MIGTPTARPATRPRVEAAPPALTGAPFGMHAVTDRHFVPRNARCWWFARFARSPGHHQAVDPLGLEDARPVGGDEAHGEAVVEVEGLAVDVEGQQGVG